MPPSTPVTAPILRFPLFPRIVVSPHLQQNPAGGCSYRYCCIAKVLQPGNLWTQELEVQIAPDEPYSIFPRTMFDMFGFIIQPTVWRGTYRWQGTIPCEWTRIDFSFFTTNPALSERLMLRVAVPQHDPPALSRNRILLGADILTLRAAEMWVTYHQIFQRSQSRSVACHHQPVPTQSCGTITLYPPAFLRMGQSPTPRAEPPLSGV